MELNSGDRIGPYTIDRELGRGGMGAVYLGYDPRLDRRVAIKALPEHLAQDPDRLARFEREARTLAQLNHPNVAGIHGVEEHAGARYLVLEFVDGETLADRLDRGPLPVDEAMEIATQIAAGVEAAHEAGVIHRDLKPGNIIVTPDGKAKVLDFGLARVDETVSASDSSMSPTLTSPAQGSPTMPGVILGTAAYMSPEQARGRRADKRSDIWSFGVILYEMLTGASPFHGETVSDSIGAILHKDIDLDRLPHTTPRGVRQVIERCLVRDRNERWRDIGDARIEIDRARRSPISTDAVPVPTRRISLALVAAIAVCFAAAGLLAGVALTRTDPAPNPVVRAVIEPAPETTIVSAGDLAGPAVISPDGSRVAYVARTTGGGRNIWVRQLDSDDPQMLRSTVGASHPFWSRDSRSLGFFADGKLKRVDLDTRSVRPLCDAPAGRGGAWLDDGTIVFSPRFESGLARVDATGGEPTPLTTVDPRRHTSHRWPKPLPGGRFLYLAVNHEPGRFDEAALYLASVSDGAPIEVMRSLFSGEVIGDTLLAVRDGVLSAFRFDLNSGSIAPEPVPIVTQVVSDLSTWYGAFSASDNGVLVYHRLPPDQSEPDDAATSADQLLYYSRDGRLAATVTDGVAHAGVSVSPDSKTVAVSIGSSSAGQDYDIWLHPVPRGDASLDANYRTRDRLTFMPGAEVAPVWSPDGAEIAFGRIFGPPPLGIYRKRVGGGLEQLLLEAHVNDDDAPSAPGARTLPGEDYEVWPLDWTDDGRFIIFAKGSWVGDAASIDVWALPVDGGEPFPVLDSSENEAFATVSPNGRWIAYSLSRQLASPHVYVEPFRPGWAGVEAEQPPDGVRWRVSLAGGWAPRWSEDGTELFYVSGRTLIAVPVETEGTTFHHDTGTPIFQVELQGRLEFDVVSERTLSDHFLVVGAPRTSEGTVNLLLNWPALMQ
jgi:serine/threonine protein kinase/Tol biopolymer transport system component